MSHKAIASLILLSLLNFGCAIGKGVRHVYTNGGVDVYEAKCHGYARTMNDCYAQASTFCDNGKFTPVMHESSNAMAPVAGSYVPTTGRNLTFTCN
jgi:hypothetical protein